MEGAIKNLKKAIADLEAKDVAGKGEALTRAMDILEELNLSLDMDAGGEIATNLRSLYDFMHRHLMQAHVRNDPQRIREVVRILEDLNEGWRAIADQQRRKNGTMSPGFHRFSGFQVLEVIRDCCLRPEQ